MIDLNRNVGTNGHPVSALHEYAVGLIYDRLHRNPNEVRSVRTDVRLPQVNGEMSGNVLDGVAWVAIPDELSAIGGFVPDIALYGEDHRPIRMIEVVTTSPPSPKKRDFFAHHSIEIIEVPCRSEDDLHSLAWPIAPLKPGESRRTHDYPLRPYEWRPWAYRMDVRSNGQRHDGFQAQQDADKRVVDLLSDLQVCSPHVRRQFCQVMREDLGTIESLLPLRADNPKRAIIYDRGDAQ